MLTARKPFAFGGVCAAAVNVARDRTSWRRVSLPHSKLLSIVSIVWIMGTFHCSIFVRLDDDQGNSPALPGLPWIQAGRTNTRRRAASRQKPLNAHLRLPAT